MRNRKSDYCCATETKVHASLRVPRTSHKPSDTPAHEVARECHGHLQVPCDQSEKSLTTQAPAADSSMQNLDPLRVRTNRPVGCWAVPSPETSFEPTESPVAPHHFFTPGLRAMVVEIYGSVCGGFSSRSDLSAECAGLRRLYFSRMVPTTHPHR